MAITFTLVRSVDQREPINRCSGMLPNQMQCYKGSTYNMIDDSTNPPTVTQLCTLHAKLAENNLGGVAPILPITGTGTVQELQAKPASTQTIQASTSTGESITIQINPNQENEPKDDFKPTGNPSTDPNAA